MGFIDDVDLQGEISSVTRDVQTIIESYPSTGLLNAHKCEIMANNIDIIDNFTVFKNFRKAITEDLTLLGAPIFEGRGVEKALKDKTATLERSITRL